jgi:hypothetical protein
MVKAAGLQKYSVSGVRHPHTSLNPHTAPAPPHTSKRNFGRNLITRYTTNSIVERNDWTVVVVVVFWGTTDEDGEDDDDDDDDEKEEVLSSTLSARRLLVSVLSSSSASLLSAAATGGVVMVADMVVVEGWGDKNTCREK